jgi:WD40 repeat protein
VRIWNAATGIEIAVLRGQDMSSVKSVAFHPDGTRIVTTAVDGTVRISDERSLLVEACTHRLTGFSILTREEMRLAGYTDATPEKDVCAGIQ